jgi:hypothetical protein
LIPVNKSKPSAFDPERCSRDIRQLLNEWHRIEQELAGHTPSPDADIPPSLFAKRIEGRMVWSGGDLESVQRALLETLSNQHAATLTDAVAKLVIWANITCPEPVSEVNLQPADKLVFSALKDFMRLGV